MKLIYLTIFMVFSSMLSAQETVDIPRYNKEETSDFKLYPNPTLNDIIYIITKDNSGKEIIVYDIFGKEVLRARITTNILNISSLSPGVYVLQVIENSKTMTRKLVVK